MQYIYIDKGDDSVPFVMLVKAFIIDGNQTKILLILQWQSLKLIYIRKRNNTEVIWRMPIKSFTVHK